MQPELIGGRYHVERAIGQGGMGTVWLCRDEKLARQVAVKQVGLLPGESVTDSARALREARSSAALSHRNVVTVFDVVEEDGRIWLVMEYVPSRSLSEIVSADGPLPAERVAAIGAQVADGLASAHAAGITHRDVKPGNVLVREDGMAKVSDFGIARTAGDPALTQTGLFVGTPLYFAPELARGQEASPASDVWALGATLYAAVEGRPPYEAQANAMAVLHDIASNTPPPPRNAGSLEPVLRRMLDQDPATRWSMEDAAHALRRIADRSAATLVDDDADDSAAATAVAGGAAAAAAFGASATSGATTGHRGGPRTEVAPAAPPPRRTPSNGRRRGLLAAAVIALLLLVGGLGYVSLTGDDGGDSSAADQGTRESPSTRQPSSKGGSPSRSPKPESSSAAPSSSASTRPAGDGAGAAQFVATYFDTVPDDTNAGWTMLSPSFRQETGRQSYEGFWSTVRDVSATDISVSGDGRTAEATLHYSMKDGRETTEQTRLELVRSGGDYQIDGQD